MSTPKVFVMLLHSPMVDRLGNEVTTAVTNMDIHDIARSCKTYGVDKYFIVNPEPRQEEIVQRILGHWHTEQSAAYHPKRVQALSDVEFLKTFEDAVVRATELNEGVRPLVAMPDARPWENTLTYSEMRLRLESGQVPALLIVLGTGWGIAPRFFEKMDVILAPLKGPYSYNHLSVRAACAIILDRLLGSTQ